jgi:DUF1680 family protein
LLPRARFTGAGKATPSAAIRSAITCLAPKGAVYGGWESDTIGGHTLGHYLSALSLMHAQTGDPECKRRAVYIVDELALRQAQSADGFVAGFTRRRGDAIEPGRLLFDEVRRGDIRPRSGTTGRCRFPSTPPRSNPEFVVALRGATRA